MENSEAVDDEEMRQCPECGETMIFHDWNEGGEFGADDSMYECFECGYMVLADDLL